MVSAYVPEAGDIVWIDFDPQAGKEQSKRRPGLVLTDFGYNRASGLCVVCPLTSTRKGYPFEVPIAIGNTHGAVLADHIKSLDGKARDADFHSKAPSDVVKKVQVYVSTLLRLR